jgi:hypothetical protein
VTRPRPIPATYGHEHGAYVYRSAFGAVGDLGADELRGVQRSLDAPRTQVPSGDIEGEAIQEWSRAVGDELARRDGAPDINDFLPGGKHNRG